METRVNQLKKAAASYGGYAVQVVYGTVHVYLPNHEAMQECLEFIRGALCMYDTYPCGSEIRVEL